MPLRLKSGAFVLAMLIAPTVEGGPVVGLDARLGLSTFAPPSDAGSTPIGATLRAGHRYRGPIGFATPELAFNADFYGSEEFKSRTVNLFNVLAGVRLGVGDSARPSLYAHAGVGSVKQGPLAAQVGLAWDAGGALDFDLSQHVALGAHVDYRALSGTGRLGSFPTLGVHIEYQF